MKLNCISCFFGFTSLLNVAKGNGEIMGKDLEAMAENCYRKRFEAKNDDKEWSFGDFYRTVAEAVE